MGLLHQLLIPLVKQHREGREQRVLAVKIVVERALRRLRLEDDLLHRRLLIALLVKELPRRRDDARLGVAARFFCHVLPSPAFIDCITVRRPLPSVLRSPKVFPQECASIFKENAVCVLLRYAARKQILVKIRRLLRRIKARRQHRAVEVRAEDEVFARAEVKKVRHMAIDVV